MGAFFWAKTIRDEFRLRGDAPAAGVTPPVGAEPASTPDTHLALLRQEVRGHGRWHGLR